MHNNQVLLCSCVTEHNASSFYPTALEGLCGYRFHPGHLDGRAVAKVCPCCISETIRCRKVILGRDIGWGCRCAMSWCDLDLTFNLVVVTLTFKILSGLISWKL